MRNWNPAVLAISGYQKFVSPYKGFSCAHRAVSGGHSCSEHIKQLIIERGLFASIEEIRQRFNDCKSAALCLNEKKSRQQTKGSGSSSTSDKACAAADAISCVPSSCADVGAGSVGNLSAGGCDACACTPF
ncbi:MAG: membrane protein insertion efficiency factor YidD [Candidatus Thiodiazotropha sp.]